MLRTLREIPFVFGAPLGSFGGNNGAGNAIPSLYTLASLSFHTAAGQALERLCNYNQVRMSLARLGGNSSNNHWVCAEIRVLLRRI